MSIDLNSNSLYYTESVTHFIKQQRMLR